MSTVHRRVWGNSNAEKRSVKSAVTLMLVLAAHALTGVQIKVERVSDTPVNGLVITRTAALNVKHSLLNEVTVRASVAVTITLLFYTYTTFTNNFAVAVIHQKI